jgi:hypothetical protein
VLCDAKHAECFAEFGRGRANGRHAL